MNFHFNPGTSKTEKRVETGFGPAADRIIENVLDKLSQSNLGETLANSIIDPVTSIINQKMRPYLLTASLMYALIIFLLVVIILMIAYRCDIFKKNKFRA